MPERSSLIRNHVAFLAFLLILLPCLAANADVLKAGVAKVDITPPLGTHMWGYFNRVKGAEGILDPLYARVLVLELGDKRLAYVDLDLGRTFGPGSLNQLRESVKQTSGIDCLIVQAIHTHAGPVIQDQYPSGTPAWETAALEKINQAVHTAQLHTEPARLGVGYGEAFIGYNRRRIEADGTVSMFWNNSARIPTWPVDPTLTVLRIDRMDGQPLAILVNYSTHPVTFGPDNLRFSADFPGQMCKTVEQAFDGKPLAFFMQGAPGDINVYDTTTPVKEDAVGRRDWAGQTLGNAAVTTAKQIQTTVDPNPSINFAEDMLPVKLRWDPEKFRQEAIREMSAQTYKIYIGQIQETMQLPVTTVLINRKIAITSVPGEPFVQFQMSWRARCPVSSCIYLGYTNGYYGYFPTIKAATEGGYGAVNAITWTQVGTGERMLDHSVIEVYKMLGRFQDSPSADWKAVPPPAP